MSQSSSANISASAKVNSASSASNSATTNSKTVTCDISGAVKHQGVYTLKNGARLQELIEAAGGTTGKVQLKAINRAILLKDQDKIHIPYKGEKVESAATAGTGTSTNSTSTSSNSSASNQESGEKVNLNTADVAGLQKLTGIGEKTFASLKDQLTV